MMPHTIAARSMSALTVLGLSASLVAGPLNPPTGPITSTYKTLTEVEPRVVVDATNTPGDVDSVFRIDAPGSYYLTGNVTGVANASGIEIDADDVTLDLNGFTVSGVANAIDGVFVESAHRGVTIRNGIVRGWGGSGVNGSSSFVRVERVHAISNAFRGIRLGNGSAVIGCSAELNGNDGISLGSGTITGSRASANAMHGFSGGAQVIITECWTRENTGFGYSLLNGGTVQQSTSRNDVLGGVIVIAGSSVIGCTVSNAGAVSGGAFGVYAGEHSTVSECTIDMTFGTGLLAERGSVVEACSVNDSDDDGIVCFEPGVTVRGCNATENGGDGIKLAPECLAINCIANNNAIGIRGRPECQVQGCVANNNTVAGILFGQDNFDREAGSVIDCSVNGSGDHGIRMSGIGFSHVSGCYVSDCAGDGINAGGMITGCTVVGCDIGIVAGNATVTNCSSSWNASHGIDVNVSTVRECTVTNNNADGILCRAGCFVAENNCRDNIESGIRVFSSGNRVEANHTTSNNQFGIEVSVNLSNFVLRNTSMFNGSGEYQMLTATDFGAILSVNGSFTTSNGFANLQD